MYSTGLVKLFAVTPLVCATPLTVTLAPGAENVATRADTSVPLRTVTTMVFGVDVSFIVPATPASEKPVMALAELGAELPAELPLPPPPHPATKATSSNAMNHLSGLVTVTLLNLFICFSSFLSDPEKHRCNRPSPCSMLIVLILVCYVNIRCC